MARLQMTPEMKDTAKQLMIKHSPTELNRICQYLENCDYGADLASMSLEEFLMSQKYKDGLIYCPHCGAYEAVKFGYTRKGHQRFKCKGCGKTFTATTKTIFEGTRLSLEDLLTLARYSAGGYSIPAACKATKFASKTILDWRHKFGSCLRELEEKATTLSNVIEADETFFHVSYKGNHYLPDRPADFIPGATDSQRANIEKEYRDKTGQDVKVGYAHNGGISVYVGPFKRDSGAFEMPREPLYGSRQRRKRGLSNEQHCVICAVDTNGHSLAVPVGRGNCSYKQIEFSLRNKIEGAAVLCTDGKRGYEKLANKMRLTHKEFSGLARWDGEYGIQRINSYHSGLKEDVNKGHKCVSSKHIGDYLALHNFRRNTDYGSLPKKILKACAQSLFTETGKTIAGREPIYTIMDDSV